MSSASLNDSSYAPQYHVETIQPASLPQGEHSYGCIAI